MSVKAISGSGASGSVKVISGTTVAEGGGAITKRSGGVGLRLLAEDSRERRRRRCARRICRKMAMEAHRSARKARIEMATRTRIRLGKDNKARGPRLCIGGL